jgi:hypothetical protein
MSTTFSIIFFLFVTVPSVPLSQLGRGHTRKKLSKKTRKKCLVQISSRKLGLMGEYEDLLFKSMEPQKSIVAQWLADTTCKWQALMHKRPPVTFTCHMRATEFDVTQWLLTALGRRAWLRPACQLMSPEDAF